MPPTTGRPSAGAVRGDEGVPAAGARRLHAVPAGGERAADAVRRRADVHAGAVRGPVRQRRQGDRPRQQALGASHYFTRMRVELSARTPLIDLCDDLFRSRCRRRERGPCTSGPCSWGAARFSGWRRPPSTRSSSTPRPSETTSRSVHAQADHDRRDPETHET